MNNLLEIKNLHAEIEGKSILRGINLIIQAGEIHAIMGPNGSGKSTLSNIIMGHPKYKVTQGQILLNGQNVLTLLPNERAKAGLFLAFQYPVEVPGVKMSTFLRRSYLAVHNVQLDNKGNVSGTGTSTAIQFQKDLKEKLNQLHISEDFAKRDLNLGFSGGEKKRAEVLQMSVLKPKLAILDEIDSGLDIDAVRTVAQGINLVFEERKTEMGILIITHYKRVLDYINPTFVHVLVDGKIVKSGPASLANELETTGYESIQEWHKEWQETHTVE
ncbi:MAG: Fe-S cluster assembly ATPase SufC [Candidatus Diapherotrites archaeon]|nr:Fe-S cluster assembly ATPase SufC [Candidatus Diapherotrites archaeon]